MTETPGTHQFYYHQAPAEGGESLSLLAGDRCLMYAVFNGDFTVAKELGEAHVQPDDGSLQRAIENFGLPRRKFNKIYAAVQSHQHIAVPEAFSVAPDTRELLTFASGKSTRNAYTHHVAGVHFSYQPNPDVFSVIERTFPNALLRHTGAVNIALLGDHPALANTEVYVTEAGGVLEICARREGKLLFYNSFVIDSNEDVLFYLLFMIEQFALDPASVRVAVSAQRPVTDPLIRDLKKYLGNLALVQPAGATARFKTGGELLSLPGHYYFSLLNQHLCEL